MCVLVHDSHEPIAMIGLSGCDCMKVLCNDEKPSAFTSLRKLIAHILSVYDHNQSHNGCCLYSHTT